MRKYARPFAFDSPGLKDKQKNKTLLPALGIKPTQKQAMITLQEIADHRFSIVFNY